MRCNDAMPRLSALRRKVQFVLVDELAIAVADPIRPFVDSILVVRGDGGVCATEISDEEFAACAIAWLRGERAKAQERRRAEAQAAHLLAEARGRVAPIAAGRAIRQAKGWRDR